MAFWFWKSVNWGYFSPSTKVFNNNFAEFIQENQNVIWKLLLKNQSNWIDFKEFCKTIKLYFHLETYYDIDDPYYPQDEDHENFHLCLDVEYGLIRRNLRRLGCVELKERLNTRITTV